MVGKANPKMRTAEEKLEIIRALRNRGTRSVREVAREVGVSPQLIYNWEKRLQQGESLEPGTEEAEEPPEDVAEAMERARTEHPTTTMSFHEVEHTELELTTSADVAALVEELEDLRVRVELLRVDNQRLRNAMTALMAPVDD